MWLRVATLLATALWFIIRAEDETLVDGLPVNCGKRLPLSPPPEHYDGSKKEAPPHSWPWHVGLYFSGFGAHPFCGGTLISPTWVLTAAHCISMTFQCVDIPLGWPFTYDEFKNGILAVKVGSHNFNNDEHLAYNVQVDYVIMHPTFPLNGPKKDSDFALLKLTRKVKRSQNVGFACLPKVEFKVNYGETCHVAGWGLIAISEQQWSEQPNVLMEQPATITRAALCEAVFSPPHSENNLCVQQSLATACVGDSGGGLHCPTPDGTWMLYGVLSRVTDRCYGSLTLFGALNGPLPWIKQMIKAFK